MIYLHEKKFSIGQPHKRNNKNNINKKKKKKSNQNPPKPPKTKKKQTTGINVFIKKIDANYCSLFSWDNL